MSFVRLRALAAIVSTAWLVAACGGGSPSAGSGRSASARASTQSPSAMAFAGCMRTHGVRNWPDPESSGQFAKSALTLQRLGVVQAQLQAAQRRCQHLYPTGGQSAQAEDRQMMGAMFEFARCMRTHSVPNWPDPVAESDPGEPNTPGFPRNMANIDQNAPQVKSAAKSCQHLMAGIGYAKGGYP